MGWFGVYRFDVSLVSYAVRSITQSYWSFLQSTYKDLFASPLATGSNLSGSSQQRTRVFRSMAVVRGLCYRGLYHLRLLALLTDRQTDSDTRDSSFMCCDNFRSRLRASSRTPTLTLARHANTDVRFQHSLAPKRKKADNNGRFLPYCTALAA
jgi:hypothetical protein